MLPKRPQQDARTLFVCTIYRRHCRGTRTARKKTFPVHTSLHSLCAATITKEIQRDRQVHVSRIYRQLFQLVQTILRETVPTRPFWSFHGFKHRRRLTTRVSQRHVVFKASEQIKSAKRKSRKSRREITSCSKNGSAQIRRNRIPGKRIFQNSTWRRIIKALDRNSYVISDRRVQRTVNTWPTNLLDRLMISREQMAALKTIQISKATRANFANKIQGSGRGDWHTKQMSSQKSIEIINRTDFTSSPKINWTVISRANFMTFVTLRMTLRKTVHAESFLVQSKDTLKTARNYRRTLRMNLHYSVKKTNKNNFCTRGSVAA